VKPANIDTPLNVNDNRFERWSAAVLAANPKFDSGQWDKMANLLAEIPNQYGQQVSIAYKQAFEIVNILSDLRVSGSTLIASILFTFIDKKLLSKDAIKEHCSEKVYKRIEGIETMNAIRSLQADFDEIQDSSHIDNLRKMLLAMVDDVKVVLIKLAESMYLLRQAAYHDVGDARQIANEVRDVYAPLANRLGVGQLKWEMEDLAFRILQNDDYKSIAKNLDEKRTARETYINNVLSILKESMTSIGVKANLEGRAKHIFSIWKKMQRKQVGFEEIYDMRAVRILVDELQDCYSALGVVHGLWKHIPKEFDDYIATPKENGYRSLHTAVIGPEGKTLEIQIRTYQMHQESELGVAAHWRYKEGKAVHDGYEEKIAWLRQLLEWQEEVTESVDLIEEFKNQVIEDRIYVFTPQGKLIDLPQGSTAIDFAYRVHTEVGHRCRGAKVNGRIIPLTQALQTGQKVEIMTGKESSPSRDWLSEHHGYIRSSRTRHKISQWFRRQDKDKNIAAGKQILEKELSRQSLLFSDYLKLAKKLNYNSADELYAGIGIGDQGLNYIVNLIRQFDEDAKDKIDRNTVIKKQPNVGRRSSSSDILVEGVGNLLTKVAGCCKPVPGESIEGYVTQGRGIVVHRTDCHYLKQAKQNSPQNVLEAEWTDSLNSNYIIDLSVRAYDRKGLLGDITAVLSEEKVNVTSLNTQVNRKNMTVQIYLQLEVPGSEKISRVMSRIERLNNIISVMRK